jgi:hypothetical protein
MLYRRSPLSPPKLLLRVIATAGVGTLLGVAACSSSSATPDSQNLGPEGSAGIVPSDASDEEVTVGCLGFCGIAVQPDACGNPGCEPSGSVYVPPEAGEPDDASPVTDADAGPATDAASDASTDDGSTGPCHPVCGIIVHPDE